MGASGLIRARPATRVDRARGNGMKRLGAAALATAWLAPLAASVAAVALLEAEPGKVERPALLVSSIVVGLAAWVVAILVSAPLAVPQRANYRSYSLLRSRIDGLRARREVVCREARHQADLICAEVLKSLDDLDQCLRSGYGIWVQGGGYIAAWEAVHRTEELLMDAEGKDELLEDAEHDILRLNGSAIPHRAELLELAQAAKVFLDGDKHRDGRAYSIEAARKGLREVRYNINGFRDSTWNGLVVLRNQTLAALLVIQLTAFALLGLAILMSAPRDAVAAAALYFLVGALFGIFNRLSAQSQADTAVDDYGLAAARLLTLPAVSGLAGLGGVLFVSLTAAQTGGTASGLTDLKSLFEFQNHPLQLLVAAAFGLAPGVLAQGLAKRAQTYQNDIKSTEPTDGGTEPRGGP